MKSKKKTLHTLRQLHQSGTPITMVTAYDATFARLLAQAEVDALLVGDSLGNVVQGHETTLPVSIDELVYHTRCVTRGAPGAFVVADLPFGAYGGELDEGIRNAVRLMKEGGASSVKLEGGRPMVELVRRLVAMGIPVMGHLGMTPQSVHQFGGHRVQGRSEAAAAALLADARALAEAGAWGVVLELIPAALAAELTVALDIPTIGIGSGQGCAGQVLVSYDLLGLNDEFSPRFLKRYERLGERVRQAVRSYADEVRAGQYPTAEHAH